MKIIDCSYTISNSSPVYPGDPKVDIKHIASFNKDGYNLTHVSLSMHTATHMDAPSHLSSSTREASGFPVELMVSDACVIDVSNQQDIALTKAQTRLIQRFEVVFLYTGWSLFYGSEQYLSHPVLTVKTAKTIIQAGVKVVVIDTPSVDQSPYKVHQLFFNHEVWIVENTRMDEEVLALKEFKAIITPIKIEAEAALTRVLIMEKDD